MYLTDYGWSFKVDSYMNKSNQDCEYLIPNQLDQVAKISFFNHGACHLRYNGQIKYAIFYSPSDQLWEVKEVIKDSIHYGACEQFSLDMPLKKVIGHILKKDISCT